MLIQPFSRRDFRSKPTPTTTKKLADRQPNKRGQFRSNLTAV